MSKSMPANSEALQNQGAGASDALRMKDRTSAMSGETIGQLVRMKNEFEDLKKLRERERASGQVLIAALKDALIELDTKISLSRESLSPTFKDVREAWLTPDSTVTIIDSTGSEISVPLEGLPSPAVIRALQECAVKMNDMMAQKLDQVARNVDSLERAVWELQNAGKPNEKPAPAAAPEPRAEKPAPAPAPAPAPSSSPQKVDDKGFLSMFGGKSKKQGKDDAERFAYNGEFKPKPAPALNDEESES